MEAMVIDRDDVTAKGALFAQDLLNLSEETGLRGC